MSTLIPMISSKDYYSRASQIYNSKALKRELAMQPVAVKKLIYPVVFSSMALVAIMATTAYSEPRGNLEISNESRSGTIGLVLTDIRYALHETPENNECPDGLQFNEISQFKQLPDQHERLKKWTTFQNRGPNGENANFSPMAVEDPLPFRELQTTIGHGFNLQNKGDEGLSAKTCPAETFTSQEGRVVTNQMARVLGCVMGWRTTGFMAEFYSDEIETNPLNRHLIEITGVDDMLNDASVEVTLYKGRDRLVLTGSGSYIPDLSHRVDYRFPQYIFKTSGRIENGVLITDPIPLARLPLYWVQITGERNIRDMQLRLELTDDGAEGYMGGYEVIDTWWNMHSKGPGVGSDVGRFSPAGLYRAALRYADGYPDPDTGQCTAISTMYKVSAVRAIIVHDESDQSRPGLMVEHDKMQDKWHSTDVTEVNNR